VYEATEKIINPKKVMIHDKDKTNIIDQYLAKTLDGKLLQGVEELINTDANFRQEVALQQKIISVVRDRERESLRIKLAELFNSQFRE
jgi:hypothetical protein